MLTGVNEAMAEMLREHCGIPDDERVAGFEQFEARGGMCDTCRWTEIRVGIDYISADGTEDRYEYHGDMADLIRTLTEEK